MTATDEKASNAGVAPPPASVPEPHRWDPWRRALAKARATAGGVVRSAQSMIDRRLHPARRSRAHALVARRSQGTVLAICYGNICRSPFAAAVLKKSLDSKCWTVASAGFFGPDRPSPLNAQTAATRVGIDLSSHRSRVLTQEIADSSDLFIVMEAGQRRAIQSRYNIAGDRIVVLGDLDPLPVNTRTVPDPYGRPVETFEECYARIKRCVDGLVRAMEASPRMAGPVSPQIQPRDQ